jgi:hypothetical protein
MKDWAKVALGAGAGLAALILLSRRGAPPQEQPPAAARAEIVSISYGVVA